MRGGVIAGDNPRSILLSVYEYLRQNGCRWLFPGVDGEFIPMQEIKPVKYRHKPTSRYRGLCNEGSEFQSGMVECIEFLPKVGMNVSTLTFDEIAEDYMSCAFGEDWKKFYDYLEKLGEIFNYEYLEGRAPGDASRSQYYSLERAEALGKLSVITNIGRKLVADHYNSEYRIRTYSVRLLEFHIMYAELLADAIIAKAKGDDDTADKLYAKMAEETGKFELAFQNCYDHGLVYYSLDKIFSTRTRSTEPIIY